MEKYFRALKGSCQPARGYRGSLTAGTNRLARFRIELIPQPVDPTPVPFSDLQSRSSDTARRCHGHAWVFHKIHIMNVASRMELGHEQRVHVPKLGLHERPAHFLETHTDQLELDQVQKLPIRMSFTCRDPQGLQTDCILPEPLRPPGTFLEEFQASTARLPPPRRLETTAQRPPPGSGQDKRARHALVDTEGLAALPRLTACC